MNLKKSFQDFKVGDIFHGTYRGVGGGVGSAICLVTGVDTKTITRLARGWSSRLSRQTIVLDRSAD